MQRHDPQARLDYTWDWTPWLVAGETITTATLTASGPVAAGAPTITGGKVTAWITSTAPSAAGPASVSCHIVTSAGREDDRTWSLYVTNR